MRKTFTYRKLYFLNQHLRNGLASKPLPVGSVALPLRSFMNRAQAELAVALELAKEQEDDQAALDEIMDREVEITFTPVQLESLLSDDYKLSLMDLDALEQLSEADGTDG